MDRLTETHVIDAHFDANIEHNADANLEHTADVSIEHTADVNLEHNADINLEHNADVNLEHNADVSIEHNVDASLGINIDIGIETGGDVDIDGEGGGLDLAVEAPAEPVTKADLEGILGLESAEDEVAGAEAEVAAGFEDILDAAADLQTATGFNTDIEHEIDTQVNTAADPTHDSDGAGSDGEVAEGGLNLTEEGILTIEPTELTGVQVEEAEEEDAPWPYEGEVSGVAAGAGEEDLDAGIGGDLSFGGAITGDFQVVGEVKAALAEEDPFAEEEGEIEEVEVDLEVDTEVTFGAVYDPTEDPPVRPAYFRADSPDLENTAPAFTLDTKITAHAATNGHPSPPPRPVAPTASFCLSVEDSDSDGELAELELSEPEMVARTLSFEKDEEPIPRVGACENIPKKKRLSKRLSKVVSWCTSLSTLVAIKYRL